MKRTAALFILLFVIFVFSACKEKQPPHIILISIDTLRADHLGCYGYNRNTSPAIDAFSKEGVLFNTCYAQSSWTLPSHVTMLSSLYPSVHQVTGNQDTLDPAVSLVSEILKSGGYTTAAFVNGGYLRPEFGFSQGFDLYETTERDEGRLGAILPRVEAWLDQPHDTPFFLFLHAYDVHEPYDESPGHKYKFVRPRPDIDAFLRENTALLKKGVLPSCESIRKFLLLHRTLPIQKQDFLGIEKNKPFPETAIKIFECGASLMDFPDSESALQYLVGCYDGGISALDDRVRRLFDALKARGLWEESLVVFTSDHGEEFTEHGGLGHGHAVYRELVEVPLIIKLPGGLHGGGKVSGMAGLVDLMPTLLDIVGIPCPENIQGKSLLPLLQGGAVRRRIYAEEYRFSRLKMASLRTGRWLYIWNAAKEEEALHDLSGDPGETTDVAGAHAAVAGEMKEQLMRFIQENQEQAYEAGSLQLDAELKAELKALGYLNN